MADAYFKILAAVLLLIDEQERRGMDASGCWGQISATGQGHCWVDVLLGTLNFAYPHRQNPLDFLAERGVELLVGATVTEFEPPRYATLTYAPCRSEEVARFIYDLLRVVHSLAPDYTVEIESADIAGSNFGPSQLDWYRALPSRWPGSVPADDGQHSWREPVLADHLWELNSAEARNQRSQGAFWIPSMDEREALELGDLALLLFQMLAPEDPEESVEERMWVLVTERRPEGRFLGRLINQPCGVDSTTHYLTMGSEVPFQTKHIVEIRRWDQSDIDNFLTNALQRKWE